MNVQGYQKLTLLDYPGRVACTVFTGGCNLRCPFCHNAGLVQTPVAYGSAEGEVLDYLSKRKGILDGVCITGGEPLLQPDLADFVGRVKEMGFLVKLDTNGTMPGRLGDLLSTGLIDYVAMDVKSSPEGYARAVGAEIDVQAIEESMRYIQGSGVAHEFRTTAVKGIHTAEDFAAIGKWIGRDEAYFIQGFVASDHILGNGCAAFDADEMQALLKAVLLELPRAALRGQA
ncbi:MAG: anaerobic ribonucleoside-triphosphate reductase activating protein [Clostridia bacterium]|nr:anaerobic ribonucleoside-triphosphate reductase activating protein [Clostridia bacterium]